MNFDVQFGVVQRLNVQLDVAQDFGVSLGQITKVSTADAYTGEYEVTPKVTQEIELQTQNKLMGRNVCVHRVPQQEVSNLSGGNTLIIGDDYHG